MKGENHCSSILRRDYFPHIDGIRALAIVPVILFHLAAFMCPGGFAGVDVFFVISGYLITGGILRDFDENRFSLRDFYVRRIRRILPAYFACLGGVYLIGFLLFYAEPLMRLSDSMVASTLFLANLYFRVQAGDYFAPALHSEPLAHLWSLSVEEQFYLIIPIFCVLLWKSCHRFVGIVLGVLALTSLILASRAVELNRSNDAFYFLHFRAWELLFGSVLACFPALSQQDTTASGRSSRTIRSILSLTGLVAVLLAYAFLSSEVPFPGIAALPSVIGASLLIRYGNSGLVGSLLCQRPCVYVGRLSYSLYLWHWPVIVYWKYATYDTLNLFDSCGIVFVTFALGYVSWRFVEVPMRVSVTWNSKRSFTFAAAGGLLFFAIGTTCVKFKAWPALLHPRANEVAYMPFPREPFAVRICTYTLRIVCEKTGISFAALDDYYMRVSEQHRIYFAGPTDAIGAFGDNSQPTVLLVGDSHAGHLVWGLDTVLRENSRAGFCVTKGAGDTSFLKNAEIDATFMSMKSLPAVTHVVISNYWSRERFEKKSRVRDDKGMLNRLERFIEELVVMGKTVLVISDVPSYQHEPPDIAARAQIIPPRTLDVLRQSKAQTEEEYDSTNGKINQQLRAVCEKAGGQFVEMHWAFKSGDEYVTTEAIDGKNVPLYRDMDHLSAQGSLRAARFLEPYLFKLD